MSYEPVSMDDFEVTLVNWNTHRGELRAVRETVFVAEQRVPVEEEWDADDEICVHALARDSEGKAVGTGRLLQDGHIGRMAVLAHVRGRGVGTKILKVLIAEATRRGYTELILHAQVHAIAFYQRFGFAADGEVFIEAGISHRLMRLALA